MKDLYTLNKQIKELMTCLNENTVAMRMSRNHSVNLINLYSARMEIMKSIAHRQAMVIRVYEDAMMANIVDIKRKVA